MPGFDIIEASKQGVLHCWYERFVYLPKIWIPLVLMTLSLWLAIGYIQFVNVKGEPQDIIVTSDQIPSDVIATSPQEGDDEVMGDTSATTDNNAQDSDVTADPTQPNEASAMPGAVKVTWNFQTFLSLVCTALSMLYLSYLCVYQARFILLGRDKAELADKTGAVSKDKRNIYLFAGAIMVGYMLFTFVLKDPIFRGFYVLAFGNVYIQFAIFVATIIFSLWVLRLGCAHIPAAIDYPLRDFLRAVKGLRFSVFLILMALLIIIPFITGVMMVFSFASLVFPFLPVPINNIIIAMFSALTIVGIMFIYNAACVYALDEIMKKADKEEASS